MSVCGNGSHLEASDYEFLSFLVNGNVESGGERATMTQRSCDTGIKQMWKLRGDVMDRSAVKKVSDHPHYKYM